MSDNQNETAGFDGDINPQEIIRNTMRELAAEVTQLRAQRDLILDGLTFLNEQSYGRFYFKHLTPTETGTLLLETNLQLETPPGTYDKKKLRVAINAESKIFTNIMAPSPASEPNEPTQEQINEVNTRVAEHAAAYGELNDQSRQQLYDQFMRNLLANAATATATPANAAAALTDIAKRVVLDGRISAMPNDPGAAATPAQRAILDGLRQGFKQRQADMTALEGAAKPLRNGLEFLQSLSSDNLEISAGVIADGNSMLIEVRAITLMDENEEPFKTRYIQVSANGKIKQGTDRFNYEPNEYDVLEEQDMEILKDIARAAAFAGKIVITPAAQGEDAPREQKVVADALQQADGERVMARLAASYIREALQTLQTEIGGSCEFEDKEPTDRGDVDFVINRWKSSQQEITVNGDGDVKIGAEEYNVFRPASLTAALKKITRTAMLQAPTIKAQNPRAQGPKF